MSKIERPRREQPLIGVLKLLVIVLVVVTVLEREKDWRANFHNGLTRAWRYVWEDVAAKDDWLTFVILTNLWSTAVYWVACSGFSVLDFANFEWTKKYKMQAGTNEPVDLNKYLKTAVAVLFNQFVVGPAFAALMMPVLRYRNIDFSADNIPGIATFLRHLVGYAICEEIGFYYSHRLFHEVKFLYKHVHKQHHEWVASISIAARYAHPVEDILANVFPIFLGPCVMGSPMVFWWIWLTIGLVSTCISHCGYHMPFLPSGEYHDFHHLRFDVNYGMLGILDVLHNTDAKFRDSINCLRHHTLKSLTSAREEFPDEFPLPWASEQDADTKAD